MAARRKKNVMTRAYRVFLNETNQKKLVELKSFLARCRDIMQYFIDLHWQRQDFSALTSRFANSSSGRKKVRNYYSFGSSSWQASQGNCS